MVYEVVPNEACKEVGLMVRVEADVHISMQL